MSPPGYSTMRDPHVVYLRYEIVPLDDDVEFVDDRAVKIETDDFTVEVSRSPSLPGIVAQSSVRHADDRPDDLPRTAAGSHEAGIVFKTHYASETAARERVEPFLRAWEIEAGLRGEQATRIAFELVGGYMEDRSPPAGERPLYSVWGGGRFVVVEPNRPSRGAQYPEPPGRFVADDRVETLWRRWERYMKGEDSLLATAYFCLTFIEKRFEPGGRGATRDRVGRALGVDAAILRKLGELTAQGDPTVARKFSPAARPLGRRESGWVEAAIRLLIRRAGEVAAAPATSPPQLTMADLPKL
jgi:hypothetical protein